MNLLSKLKHKYLSDLLLYSFLGCISYFILIKFSNVSIRLNEGVMQLQVFIAFLFLFNGVGMSIRYATERMKARSSSPQKKPPLVHLFRDHYRVGLTAHQLRSVGHCQTDAQSPSPVSDPAQRNQHAVSGRTHRNGHHRPFDEQSFL